jgi:hypothetical protein
VVLALGESNSKTIDANQKTRLPYDKTTQYPAGFTISVNVSMPLKTVWIIHSFLLVASGVAITAITASCASHHAPIHCVGAVGARCPNQRGAGSKPNSQKCFFHVFPFKNQSGRNAINCQILASGTVTHWDTAALLILRILASSLCDPANWTNCSFVIWAL